MPEPETRSRRWLRRLASLVLLAAAFGGFAPAAWAYWTGSGAPAGGLGKAGAASVGSGAVPSASRVGATGMALEWGATTLSNGVPVDGYIVRRYASGTGAEAPVTGGCVGVVAAQACSASVVPTGSWRYTVTPVFASAWRGDESVLSGAITIGPATLTLDENLFGGSLPAQATGSITGFAANEPVTYRVGGVSTAGAPTHVDAAGAATITALTIPAGADGPRTVAVTGSSSGIVASAGILIDTTPPTLTSSLSPAPNAAGWNRTPVKVTGSADDGTGSGLRFVKVTLDGSDPRTSPTAQFYDGVPLEIAQTTTGRYYGVDFAGNETAVESQEVKIDTIAPEFVPTMVDVVGGAVIRTLPPAPGVSYYRGAAAGSFTFNIATTDAGGSGVAGVGTSSLVDVETGFTHTPGNVLLPGGGAARTNPFSWVAGTSSTPTGSVTVTDAADNSTTGAGALYDDSAAPVGGSIGVSGLGGADGSYSTSKALHLALSPGTDDGSGLASGARLARASAPLSSGDGVTAGVCGAFGAAVQVGSDDPGATVIDTVPDDDRCYRYQYTVPDAVGNVATIRTADFKVETAAPATLTPSSVKITPATGTGAQLVVGTTLYYKPAQTGSFVVAASASDQWSGVAWFSFPSPAGFSGGGAVAAPATGSVFRTTYSWSGNAASPSPGTQALSATNNAGQSPTLTGAFSLIADATGPVHALTLTSSTGAYLSGATLYYRPTAAGSFRFVDALADAGSGPRSVTYPAINLSGWTHAAEVVTTPSGGPFVSQAIRWGAQPASLAGYAITGVDGLGTVSAGTITFIGDQTPPSSASVAYAGGTVTSRSVAITTGFGSDAQSGVALTSGLLQRDQATLNTATGTCGSFPNTFATTIVLAGGADISVSNAHCYQYRFAISDNVGNQRTSAAGAVVKLDTTPKVTAVTSRQAGGAAGDGRLQVGDQLVLTFNENLTPASLPSTFSGATESRAGNGYVQLAIPGITGGPLSTNSSGYLAGSSTATATFAGGVALVNAGASTTVTVTVTALSGATTAAGSGSMPFVAAAAITGVDGTGASGTFTTAAAFRLF